MPRCASPYDLPLEIWQQILTLSCTDGGYTGTSLALVSRFFHAASHLVRFRSLRFTSLRQIEGFFTYLENYPITPRRLVPKVNHLLLSFPCAPPDDSSPDLDDNMGNRAPLVWYHERQLRDREKAGWDKQFLMLVPRLLELVAPYLETLALVQSDAFIIPAVCNTLPKLRELTLLVGIEVMLSEDDDIVPTALATALMHPLATPAFPASITPATRPLGDPAHLVTVHARDARFPALERLHLVCGRHRDWTLREPLSLLPRLAPALTHLRISNVTYTHGQDECIPAFLYDALEGGTVEGGGGRRSSRPFASGLSLDDGHGAHRNRTLVRLQGSLEDGAPRVTVMPRLKRVVVHSLPPPCGGGCDPCKDYTRLVNAVETIGVACARSTENMRVRLVEGERVKHTDWEQIVTAQWIARIEDGSGCWEDEVEVSSRL
ncbi:hypothetical protein C8Q74DRAFT_1199283 [Fomes fomentarius]|nr:hypothetical protein C8Q74DRAFT_1199283 [Fomes fomentarius]